MSLSTSVALFSTLLAVGTQVRGQATGTYPATPLAEKTFAYDALPYQADTDTQLIRGSQSGFNQCNDTTESQSSKCQTSVFNNIGDFCLWAPQEMDIIANTEGEEVAWCTTKHGGRLIPEGTITGLQLIETSEYLQLTGFLNGPNINIQAGDFGGELDPHGADLRGNPLGGLMYSTAWSGNNDTYQQVFEWHQFIGADGFCFRICKPTSTQDASYCQHIYDRIGCSYNDPADAKDGEFTHCQGDVGLPPGIYVEGGVTMTYTQPAESLGAITSMPYTATIPLYSQCTTFASTALFADLASVSATQSGASTAATGTKSSTKGSTSGATGTSTRTSSGSSASSTGNGAINIAVGGFSMVGVIFSAIFLS
ncbi:hypothetical protein BDZ89DRAFT_1095114 [Hymenopellis radicata]|nr:hypothetical protein BDZ89DRAFT_1095114 [Hymenopellis radicata]